MRPLFRIRNGFVRDSAVLIAGGVAANLAVLAATPILTRLYNQTNLAALGAFVGLTSLVGQLACLRYEQAIMIADEEDVPALIQLAIGVNASIAALLEFAVWIGGRPLMSVLDLAWLEHWLWLIPITSFAIGLFQLTQMILSRQRVFAVQSHSRIAKSSGEVLTQILWGIAASASTAGLLVGFAAGIILQAAWVTPAATPTLQLAMRQRSSLPHLLDVARRYRNFPLFAVPHGLASTFGQQGFTLLLAALIGPQVAGLYYLAHRLLAAPSALISLAVMPTFYQQLSEMRHRHESAQNLIASVFVGLFVLGAVPLMAVAVVGPWLFGFCFGSEWIEGPG